jgi:hypothetical protein
MDDERIEGRGKVALALKIEETEKHRTPFTAPIKGNWNTEHPGRTTLTY